ASVFGQDVYSLPVYLKSALLQRKIDSFLDDVGVEDEMLDFGHRRNLKFYVSMYVACAVAKSCHATADMILELDPAVIQDGLMTDCYERVLKHYIQLTQDDFPDSVAKGTKLLKVINTELKRRFSPRKKKVALDKNFEKAGKGSAGEPR
ncbi:MAG: hypothetical protein DMG91_17180, partial [Acidobacteria bacterium]